MTKMIDKIAQRRSIWNRIRPSNVTKQLGRIDRTYNKEYKALRNADNAIRKLRAPGNQTAKDLLKEMRKAFKSHRWATTMDRAARISILADRIAKHEKIDEFLDVSKGNFGDFYFEGGKISTDNIEEAANKNKKASLKSEALFGDSDWARRRRHDLMGGSSGNKRVERAIVSMYNKAEALAELITQTYKDLDSARAQGKIGDYIASVTQLRAKADEFDKTYKATHSAVKEFLPKAPTMDEVEQDVKEEEVAKEEVKEEEKPEEKPEGEAQEGGEDKPEEFTEAVQLGESGLLGDLGEGAQEQIEGLDLVSPLPKPPAGPSGPPTGSVEPDVYTSAPAPGPDRIDMDALLQPEGLNLPPAVPLDAPMEQSTFGANASVYPAKIKKALATGDRGVAVALLSKYSQDLEDAGNITESARILAIAQEVFNGK